MCNQDAYHDATVGDGRRERRVAPAIHVTGLFLRRWAVPALITTDNLGCSTMSAPIVTPVPPPSPVAPQDLVVTQKPLVEKSLNSYFAGLDPIVRPVKELFGKMSEIRHSLNLPNLGTVEKMQNEVKST